MATFARREALIQRLRRSGHVKVDALVRELGVSRRTIMRDLSALRERGFVIDGESGRGGGIRLDPHSILISTRLNTSEVLALILSVEMLRATPWMPFSEHALPALSKIEATLPPTRIRELRYLLKRVLIGQPIEQEHWEYPGPVDPALVGVFEYAFTRSVRLQFAYRDRKGASSSRTVEPQAILVRAPFWYVIAWDPNRQALRLFRMDRIDTPKALQNESFQPRPFTFVTGICPDAKPVVSKTTS